MIHRPRHTGGANPKIMENTEMTLEQINAGKLEKMKSLEYNQTMEVMTAKWTLKITRVPGGWLYIMENPIRNFISSPVFVAEP